VLATSAGGVGRHVRSLVAGLTRRDREVLVCGPAATEDLFDFTGAGARFYAVEIATGPRPLHDVRAVARIRSAVAGADIVHAHGLRAGLLGGLAVPRTTPYVVTWHNAVLATGARRRAYAWLERVVARRADVTLAVSEDLVERARRLGAVDVRHVEIPAPPLPPALRSPAQVRAELGAEARPLVLALGRLHPQKGFDQLVRAATGLADRVPAPLVAIAGDGPQREAIAAQIASLRAPVTLLGRRDDVADLLAAADVAVMSSVWEGWPLAAQEILRAGVPLVATRVGGVPELVGDAAVLVPPADSEALAREVARLLDDPAACEALRSRAAARAQRWPGEAAVIDATVSLYVELRSR
jgi:glycosyltransferase involved in cell wall biosynthesis